MNTRHHRREKREQMVMEMPAPGVTLRGRLLIWAVLAMAFSINVSIVITYERTALELGVAILGIVMALGGAVESLLTYRQDSQMRQVINTMNHKLAYTEAELGRYKRSHINARY